MEIIDAYETAGSYRGAALYGTTPKTVERARQGQWLCPSLPPG